MAAELNILVIDDEPQSLEAVLSCLRAQGWRVSTATNGKQGFHRAQALAPDVILLDVLMPDLDGYATCRLLRVSPRTENTPVIFMSSAGDSTNRLEGLRLGAVDYVTKPSLPAEVVARIRIHLQRPSSVDRPSPGSMPVLSDGETTLHAATRLILANLAELPPLAEIARRVGTHDKNLSAVFRKYLGTTVFAWVREQRLLVGRKWLLETEMSIQDIAANVGFHSAANFTTAFRKRIGVTPSQYRKNAQ